ncbi:MAG: cyclic nucleotide-binding domain-containing protein [Syntrophobacteraceae bacterium]
MAKAGPDNPARDVAVLLTDMEQYAKRIEHMAPEQIRDFIVGYHQTLQTMIMRGDGGAHEFEPASGDGAQAIFERRPGEGGKEKCRRALRVAVDIAKAVELRQLPFTRIGIFAGEIAEAQFGKFSLKFGRSFAAAARLESLCAYFGATILMDRDIAWAQDHDLKYIVSIAKVTPKNFDHPIHVYSIYKPGIHRCPDKISEQKLMEFIQLKNEGVERFLGNTRRNIAPNFPCAVAKLEKAIQLFHELTGETDMATLRILDYIRENPYPSDDFDAAGMKIDEKQGGSTGIRLLRLPRELFRAIDNEIYHALVEDTRWEKYFRIVWVKEGEAIIRTGDEPNGLYYLAKGKVGIEDEKGHLITQLSEGDVFGDLASLSKGKRWEANAVALTDVVLRVIATDDFDKSSVLRKLFAAIAEKRLPLAMAR